MQVLLITEPLSDDELIMTGMYRIYFKARHPTDLFLTDDLARWWSEWHHFTFQKDDTPLFKKRLLVFHINHLTSLLINYGPMQFLHAIQIITCEVHLDLNFV